MKNKARRLKVCPTGDFWKGESIPQIRLQGKWLADAGIAPESHVRVENPTPGVLVIRLDQASNTPSTSL